MLITAKSLKNPHYLSAIVDKLNFNGNNSDTDSVITTSSRTHLMTPLNDTVIIEEEEEENEKKENEIKKIVESKKKK